MTEARGMLEGLRALVVGADDIGQGIARRFEREGARVSMLAGDDALRADAHSIAATVTAEVERLGGLDVLVCNLLPPSSPVALESTDENALAQALAAVQRTLAVMRAALPALKLSGRGRIMIVGHRYGENVSEALGPYNAAAWGLVGLSRTAAVEWGQHQITTNVLLPLARTAEFEAAHARRPAIVERLIAQLPLRHVGDPADDVGGAAVFLASDAAGFVNGEVLCADGGQQVAGPVLNPARFV